MYEEYATPDTTPLDPDEQRQLDRARAQFVKNPSIVLDRDHGFVYALAFTDRGMIRGPRSRKREAAVQELRLRLKDLGAKIVTPETGP